ncbi:hypothetical protein ACIRP7_14035 [Streptomyces sp. NPDC102270]|uniref:hypothetical protein n=1 Tax=Streptomyces sp. NPDC102270 TaxID=3366150 RepID=UPI003830F45F
MERRSVSRRSEGELPEAFAGSSTGSATSSTDWTPDPDDFEGLDQEGWFEYVTAAHEAYDKPSLRTIMRQARKREKGCTLGHSTVHDVLGGHKWPTQQTAYWLGIGIGGHALGAQFRAAWTAADGNLRKEVHQEVMGKQLALREHPGALVQRRQMRQEERQKERARWRRRKRERLMMLVSIIMGVITLIEMVIREWGTLLGSILFG